MSQYTVFFSHAHADNDLCDVYAEKLKKLGIDVWYDRVNMDASYLIPETIGEELRKRTALVIMLTPHSTKSKWVGLEIATFLSFWAQVGDEERKIIPVRLVECEVPPILRAFKSIDATLLGQEETCALLARTLGVEPPAIGETEPLVREEPVMVPILSNVDLENADISYDDNGPQTDADNVAPNPSVSASEVEEYLDIWLTFVEDKWRAISDSQLGWKPLRGRWSGWEQIYSDTLTGYIANVPDNTAHRFDTSQTKGSAASAVAAFLHDLDILHESIAAIKLGNDLKTPDVVCHQCGTMRSRLGSCPVCGAPPPSYRFTRLWREQLGSRNRKHSPSIIRNPLLFDAE